MHIYFLTQKQNSPAYITPNISSSPPSQPAEVCGLCGVTCGRVPARPSVTGWAVVMLRDSLLANTRNLSFLRMVYSCKVLEENEFWDIQRKLWLGGKHPRVEISGRAICKSKRSESKVSKFHYLPLGRASLNFANDLQSSRLTGASYRFFCSAKRQLRERFPQSCRSGHVDEPST